MPFGGIFVSPSCFSALSNKLSAGLPGTSTGRLSPLASFRTIAALRRLHRQLAPAVTHHVSLQTIMLGSLAAQLASEVLSIPMGPHLSAEDAARVAGVLNGA